MHDMERSFSINTMTQQDQVASATTRLWFIVNPVYYELALGANQRDNRRQPHDWETTPGQTPP